MSNDRISLDSLRSGEHEIAARADLDPKRALLFVRRSFDRLAICTVEANGPEITRLLGVTGVTPTGLSNIEAALDSLGLRK